MRAPVKHPARWHAGAVGDRGQCCAACLQMMEVVRLQGAPSEADSIGELVWVLDELSGCWWPAELLDPFNLPIDRQLPKGAIAGKCHTVCTGHSCLHWAQASAVCQWPPGSTGNPFDLIARVSRQAKLCLIGG